MKDNNTNEALELPIPDTSEGNTDKKTKKKKIIIISVFAALCLLGGLSWFLLYMIPETGDVNPMFDSEKQEEIIGMYGSTQTYLYYPIDYDLDIMTVKEYLDLDRNIYYTKGAETFALAKEDMDSYTDDVKFFVKYFELAISGDYNAYNELFTDNYYSSNDPYYSFTQQMIYDMKIEKLGEGTENGNDAYYYNVSYKIHRNNGTFRNDIGSDGSKTLYFALVEIDDTILIDKIDYYVS